uniref:Cystatin domain-containing protein n=1 Tax=Cercocebus atys TaxID=9531 RepID=A0A2K5MH47_CERAT
MAQPLCTLLLLLAALAGAQAWSPEEEDRVISGGIHDADLNDDEVQHALHFAISEYNKATEDEYYRRPLRVLRAREQKQLCSFQIYEVPWEDRMSLVNSRCQEA